MSRYQKEIEEILRQAGDVDVGQRKTPRRSLLRLVRASLGQSLGGKTWSISPGRVMLFAGIMLLAALLIRPAVSGLVAPLALAGLLLFIVGYGMAFARPTKIQKRWRGQPIEQDDRDSWWNRIRRRIR